MATIAAHATSDGQGRTTVTIGQGGAIAGVGVARLQKHAGDFVSRA